MIYKSLLLYAPCKIFSLENKSLAKAIGTYTSLSSPYIFRLYLFKSITVFTDSLSYSTFFTFMKGSPSYDTDTLSP